MPLCNGRAWFSAGNRRIFGLYCSAPVTLCFTLKMWGFTSNWHPLFQFPNSSPDSMFFFLFRWIHIFSRFCFARFKPDKICRFHLKISLYRYRLIPQLMCFTLEFWGFSSDWHPLFQFPNSSPDRHEYGTEQKQKIPLS